MTASPLQISGESERFDRFRLDCAALTAAGRGRAFNEDRCLFAAPGHAAAERAGAGWLFAVIDGAANEGRGRAAAHETETSILEIFDDERCGTLRPDLLQFRLQDANDRVARFVRGRCAVSAVWIWEEPGRPGLAVGWAHIGDTRIYQQGEAGWKQLTRDHAKGRLLDRAIGGGPSMRVDTGTLTLRAGERLALLSDGVWSAAPPRSVFAGRPFPSTAEAVRQLVGQARLNSPGEDTSAIVITARDVAAGPEPEH